MPSNHIYEITEDNNGFLWIGSDNGVSRFDGKRFVNYSTKNGLPSNDVIQIRKEKNGTIWANCYKQPPSYFDEKSNRFISFESNKKIIKSSRTLLNIQVHPVNGIYFQNSSELLFFKNKKLADVKFNYHSKLLFINNKEFEIKSNKLKPSTNNKLNQLKINQNNTLIETFFYSTPTNENTLSNISEENGYYELYRNYINYFKINSAIPFKVKLNVLKPGQQIKWYSSSKNEFALITVTGKIMVYDKTTFELKNSILTNKEINYYYKDVNNNVWLGSLNNGLLKFSTSQIQTISEFGSLDSNFLSIHVTDYNTLLAGNHQGEIYEKGKKSLNHKVVEHLQNPWIRSIASFNDKTIITSDMGYCINYGKCNNLYLSDKRIASLKTAQKLNDSILLLGNNNGIFKLNVLNNTYKYIKSPNERILSIDKIDDFSFYFTANLGVYKYDLKNETYSLFFSNSTLQNDNIQCIESSSKGTLWFSTFKGGIYLVQKNKILFSLTNSNNLPINCTKLLQINKELWIASKDGIYILNSSKLPKYSIRKISKVDGLTSNHVNDFVHKNDSVYVATSTGISIIPISLKNKNNDCTPIIISVKINNKNELCKNSYSLKQDQKNIVLELAGVDLTGHFNKFQYSINRSKIWYSIEGNILNLLLKSGENNIEIRAIDENNFISPKKLKINIDVAIPFHQTFLFWIILIIFMAGLSIFYYTQRKLEKQKINYEKQLLLEQQRNKITADLHDDIGSTLSSLQINSVVANKLIYRNPNEAQKVLEKIESQSQNLADKIGDIIWSMKPGKDEFLTMSSRIKNFANEIIGSTNIDYKIEIDSQIDVEVTDITTRKNIVLITKETINNAVKYSKAKQINVVIQMQNSILTIKISDNGIGFDPTIMKGNGITNIKTRVSELKGTLTIISNPLTGTEITITIPHH
ncbi:sensor histidine kinase [Flavobacterium sp.]|uniref:sensor histidine kinase n=1 Tax=Flavobacterium sp. TaxID=239 RepID=UPI00261F7461|nr:sensor histidine kinase [Flavobacterium sp.]